MQAFEWSFFFLLLSNSLIQGIRESSVHINPSTLVGYTALASALVGGSLSRGHGENESFRVVALFLLWAFGIAYWSTTSLNSRVNDAFFVLAGVATLLLTSTLWSLAVRRDMNVHRKRFHGFGLQSSLGQACGSVIGWLLTDYREVTLGLAVVTVVVSAFFVSTLSSSREEMRTVDDAGQHTDKQVRRSKLYLSGIALFQFFNCTTTSLVLIVKLQAVQKVGLMNNHNPTAAAAEFTTMINVLASSSILILQFIGVSEHISTNTALVSLPIITGSGLFLVSRMYSNDLSAIAGLVVATRTASYALSKPAREGLFRRLSNTDRARGKPFVDAVLCKLGTLLAALYFERLMENPLAMMGLIASWIAVALILEAPTWQKAVEEKDK